MMVRYSGALMNSAQQKIDQTPGYYPVQRDTDGGSEPVELPFQAQASFTNLAKPAPGDAS